MGNTHARYFSLDDAKLRTFLEAHPQDDDDEGDDRDADERAEELLERLATTAAAARLESHDVVHDLAGDLGPRLEDADASRVWVQLLAALGHPVPPSALPWWLEPLTEAHWVALTPPRAVTKLAASIAPHRGRFVEATRPSGAQERLTKVMGFLDGCVTRGSWLLAIESMG